MKIYKAFTPVGICEVFELNGKYELVHEEDYEKFLFEPIKELVFEREIIIT